MTTDYTAPGYIDPNDFLMGGGIPSAHAVFDKAPFGTTLTGTITARPEVEQQKDLDTGKLKFWDSDNKPMMQLVITLQTGLRNPEMTDDTGLRKLYVKSKLKDAVQTAVRLAKARGLEIGGVLTVTYVADGEQKKAGKNPPKFYTATYVPPQAAAANEFLNGQQPAQAAPQQYAAPPAQGFVPANQGAAPQWAAPAPQQPQPGAYAGALQQSAAYNAAQAAPQQPAPAPAAPPAADGQPWTPPPGMDPTQAEALAALQPAQRAALGY